MGSIRWRGFDHPEMYDMINSGPGASASTPVTSYWEGLSKDLDQINSDLNDGLKKLNVAWEGDAAQAAQGGLNPLQQWSSDAQVGADVMKISSVDQAQYVSTARNEMPEPVQVTTPNPGKWDKAKAAVSAVFGNSGPAQQVAQQSADHEAQEAAQQAAAQKAVQTMDSYQSSSEWNRDSLGTFVPAPDVVVSVNPESGKNVKHVMSQTQSTPNTTSSSTGTTHASGFVAPTTQTGGLTPTAHTVPTGPVTTGPTGPTGPVSTMPGNPTGPGVTTPSGLVPSGPAGTNPPSTGTGTGTGLPPETTTNPRPGNPVLGTPPNGGPVTGEPVEGRTPGGRAPIAGPGENVPGRGPLTGPGGNGNGRNNLSRNNLGRTGGGGLTGEGDQVRNPGSRLRPGASPNAFEEGAGRGGSRAGLGARGANAYAYGEEPGARAGGAGGTGGVGGTGGRGAGGESTRSGNRFGRGAGKGTAAGESVAAEESRVGGRSGSRGAGGRLGRREREEEDQEYQHAEYLVDTEDVFVDDRLVAPPVIGERPAGT